MCVCCQLLFYDFAIVVVAVMIVIHFLCASGQDETPQNDREKSISTKDGIAFGRGCVC